MQAIGDDDGLEQCHLFSAVTDAGFDAIPEGMAPLWFNEKPEVRFVR